MFDFLLALMQESPVLFLVLMVNIGIVAYIVLRIALYLTHQKQPGKVVDPEKGAVPPRDDAQSEIPGNHAVNRDHQGCGQGREKEVPPRVMPPLLMFARPS